MTLIEKLQERTRENKAREIAESPIGLSLIVKRLVKQELTNFESAIKEELKSILQEVVGREGVNTLKGDPGKTPILGIDYFTPKELARIKREAKGRDGRHGRPGKDGAPGLTEIITKESLSTPQQIADKINTLEEALEQKTIKGLVIYLRNLNRAIREKKPGGGGGDSVSVSDLSGSTDGSTKTFTVPRHITGKTLVISTQFPIIYRPTTDFTETATTITLTSAVGAPETGQSLLVYYVRG